MNIFVNRFKIIYKYKICEPVCDIMLDMVFRKVNELNLSNIYRLGNLGMNIFVSFGWWQEMEVREELIRTNDTDDVAGGPILVIHFRRNFLNCVI